MWRLARLLLPGLVATSCVVGTVRPSSRVEIARAPTEGNPSSSAETGFVAGCAGAHQEAPEAPRGPAVFIDGYCHYDGVRYVWHEGSWRARAPDPVK